MATWLLFTGYKNSRSPYPMVPALTHYDVPFSHNRQKTDKRTTGRTISTIASKVSQKQMITAKGFVGSRLAKRQRAPLAVDSTQLVHSLHMWLTIQGNC